MHGNKQVFVRPVGPGKTLAIAVDNSTTAGDLLHLAAARIGWQRSLNHLGLAFQSRQLRMNAPLSACGVEAGSTVHMTARVLGGIPLEVKLLTPQTCTTGCGKTVTIDVEPETPMYEVKLQLQEKTGVPVEAQKVMLEGIGKMVMGDKRTNIGFTHCGQTGSFYLATFGVKAAAEKSK